MGSVVRTMAFLSGAGEPLLPYRNRYVCARGGQGREAMREGDERQLQYVHTVVVYYHLIKRGYNTAPKVVGEMLYLEGES